MVLDLTSAERDELVGLIEEAVTNVKSNVRRTHSPEWKEGFHREEELLVSLLDRLKRLAA